MDTINRPPGVRQGRLVVIVATIFAGLGFAIYGVDSDFVNFFLPTRMVVLTGLLVSAGILALHLALRIRSSRSVAVYGLAVAALVLAATMVYVREFTAYREVELSFENEGARLAGALYLPKQSGRYPAVVIAQGSIRAPRRLYHFWADRLVRSGIAVFSFDKRGTGDSGGVYEAENNSSLENLTLLASDVAAAIVAVRRHAEIDGARVGILGLSMGGWLAPLAAQRADSVGFMALVSGPTVSVGEENYFSDLTGERHGEGADLSAAAIDSLVMARPPSDFDPRPLLRESSIPSLWLFGREDSSVPVAKSKAVLDSLVSQYNRPYRYVIFPEADHLGFVMKWPFDLAPGFLDELTGWIALQTRQ